MPNVIQAAGVEIDLRRMDLPANLAETYSEQIAAAVTEMKAIEAGEEVNSDEGRQVGHYWLRNPELAPADVRSSITQTWKAIEEFVNRVDGRFQNILWIGIGGSGLGPQLLYDSLRVPGVTPRMFFFDNTDPSGFKRTLLDIQHAGGLDATLTVVVSKSGGTKETANGMKVAMCEYERVGLSFQEHAVAVTQPASALDQLASDWLDRFAIWDFVGGRTSFFSAVGLLPSDLLGFDTQALMTGAREMDNATRGDSFESNAALQLATVWFHAIEHVGLRNMVVLPYCDRITLIPKYMQQLIMESLGKEGKGISVFGNKGSTDQHSYVQQLRDGYRDFFAVFLRVLDPGTAEDAWEVEPGITPNDYLMAFAEGTAEALSEAGRPSMRLTIDRFNERALGEVIALIERTVGYYGAMLGINAYHQPGVEAGKNAASELLQAQIAVQKHLPDDPSQLLADHRQMRGFSARVRAAEQLGALSDDFISDLLNRLAVSGRLSASVLRKNVGRNTECEEEMAVPVRI